MTCEKVKSLLSEFADETLDVAAAWQVQTHLADCTACHRLSGELRSLRQMLQGLPTQQPSAQFEARLAERLALTRRPQTRITWRNRFAGTFHFSGLRLRPALALGFALSAVAAFVWMPQRLAAPPEAPAARVMDRAFVADCVAQHRREAATEPLADLAAQNLAGHLDNSPASTPAVADAGMF